ncbi:MAG: DUF4105 domain-containing protein [Idiomarina sp.]
MCVLVSIGFANTAVAGALESLAQQRQWLKVLQYNEHGVSEVQNQDFFFANSGATDAMAELKATLAAFAHNNQAICQFPARHMLTTKAGLTNGFDYESCVDYQAWLRTNQAESITLVFADGYLKNPASFHGHLFIRIDSDGSNSGHLLDNSLNFGADVPPNENPITYIAKGLLGGYQARYSAQPFYRHNLSYGVTELRTLWDYELELTSEQTQLLAAHLWELSRTDYQYFFTSKNCAYYVARALELVTQSNLVHSSEWTVLPTDIIQRLNDSNENLVRSITANESEQSLLQSRFYQLSLGEQQVVRDWVQAGGKSDSFAGLAKAQQKRVLITLSSYYSFLERQSPDELVHIERKTAVLQQLLHYEPGNTLPTKLTAAPPHLGQPANLLRLSYRAYDQGESGVAFSFRPSYYDRLQPATGKLPNSALSMGDIEFSYLDNQLALERLWLVNIEALNISNTGLPGDGGGSWLVRAGAERERLRVTNPRLATFVEGGIGRARSFGSITPYAFVQGRLHSKEASNDNHYLTIALRAGFDFNWQQLRGYCEVEQPASIGSSWSQQTAIKRCASSLYSQRNGDVRVVFAKQHDSLIELALSFYF